MRIDPERPSVRLMGTRFVIDSWILDQLVGPNVGTQTDPRVLGSPLDLAAAFGSDVALAIQDEAGETAYVNYPEQMEAMRAAVAARPDEAWGQTVYDAWLAAVEPMWLPHGAAFPDFMRAMPGMPRPSRPASAPTPSSSTTPSSTPSRPPATRAVVRPRARCATGSSPTRCPSSAWRPWPC